MKNVITAAVNPENATIRAFPPLLLNNSLMLALNPTAPIATDQEIVYIGCIAGINLSA